MLSVVVHTYNLSIGETEIQGLFHGQPVLKAGPVPNKQQKQKRIQNIGQLSKITFFFLKIHIKHPFQKNCKKLGI